MGTDRKQLKRMEGTGTARYLTFSCYRRLPLFGNDAIKDAFVDQLIVTRERLCLALLGWVVKRLR